MLTLGSLFDGIGGFPLAGVMCGIRPVWSSEIEPFPLKVTAARFPGMKQLGSVTDIDGGAVYPVDIITFGSPCQDLSTAGKQLGIHEGQRSNLFFEAVRIIKEMRAADERIGRTGKHIRPRFAVWENVPGAFSSNKGADFKAVLEALAGVREDGVDVPRPKKWNTGGGILGNGWSIAWRVYDAQYWGVPQRRKRIYLVADFAGERAPEILFERESVRGNPAAGGEAGEGAAADAEGGIGGGGGVRCLNPWDSQRIRQYDVNGVAPNINANSHGGQNRWGVCYPAAFMGGQGAKARSIGYCDDGTTPTIRAAESGSNQVPDVCYPNTARALTARHDSSPCVDRGQNVVCYEGQNVCTDTEVAFTLQAGRLDDHHIPGIAYEAIALAWANSGNAGLSEGDVAPTIKAARNGEPAIMAFCASGGKAREYDGHYGDVSPTIRANAANTRPAVCVGNGQMCNITMQPVANTLDCMHDQQAVLTDGEPPRKYIVRRLTPTECARLQGFPDEWCDGLGGSDSAIYKAYGNGLALPCAFDVMQRIARFVERKTAPDGA